MTGNARTGSIASMPPGREETQERARARVGQVLRGKWRLDRLLGVGGTACVYAATHRNGKRGAVKLLLPELAADDEARRRFLREGYVANRIEHPGAVAVLDDDTAEDGSVFLVMELLEGQTLEDRARSRIGGRLDPSEVALIADKLLDVLVAAHAKGIVHRDMKPENVFLTHRGDVKILDFGIARMHDAASPATIGRMTEVGHIMGTPSFMPPEQALGHLDEIDGRTDLWALGAVMFYVLTGKLVHEAETVNKVLLSAMTRQAPPVASVVPGLPQPPLLCAVVDRALMFQREARFPDARAMQHAVRVAMQAMPPPRPLATSLPEGGHAVSMPTLPSHPRSGRGLRRVAIVAGLVGLLALGLVLVFARGPAPTALPEPASASPVALPAPASPAPSPAPSAAPAPLPSQAVAAAPPSAAPLRPPSPATGSKAAATSKTPAPKPTGGSKDIFSQW